MGIKISENVELASLTTFKIGGKARFFTEIETEVGIIEAIEFAERNQLEIFILGGGSNVLIADEGFNGLVVKIAVKGIDTHEIDERTVHVTGGAGEDWDKFVEHCVERNLQGIECLSGIPGLVGGTPVQNVGAYGQEVSETIYTVRVYDRKERIFKDLTNGECGFEYRKSIFNSTEKNRYIVASVTFALNKNNLPIIKYADLIDYLAREEYDLKKIRQAVCAVRARKSMLVRQGGTNAQSAGSFFKNPLVTIDKFSALKSDLGGEQSAGIPYYAVNDEHVKIPAAWLIENAGFSKGYIKCNAGLSTVHTLALINRNDARAREIIDLMKEIQLRVKKKFDIELKPEPVFVGFKADV